LRADRDPRVVGDGDVVEADDEGVAAAGALDVDGAGGGGGGRRRAGEAGPQGGGGLVRRALGVAGRGGPGLDPEGLARADAQQRLVAPVEGVLAGLLADDALHGTVLLGG